MEEPIQFTCNGKKLYGILHVPEEKNSSQDVVLMVTGGPQTRYGSHRLYVKLARFLCERGVAVLRFDYEGMGDSEGKFAGAEYSEESIVAAVKYIDARFPAKHRKIIWSLCDGSTASAMHASRHKSMVAGLILCNPYIHDETALYRKHYYKKRVLEKDFWISLLILKTRFREAILEAADSFWAALLHSLKRKLGMNDGNTERFTYDCFLSGIRNSRIPIYFILSSNDEVASEFREKMASHKALKRNRQIEIFTINNADHTFTQPDSEEELFLLTAKILGNRGVDGVRHDEIAS